MELTNHHSPAAQVVNVRHSLPLAGEWVNILNGVSFSIHHGEWVALTGPSGSGKIDIIGDSGGFGNTHTGAGVN